MAIKKGRLPHGGLPLRFIAFQSSNGYFASAENHPMNILVTGASGLVGRPVVEYLSRRHDVTLLDRIAPQRRDLPFHQADILDPSSLPDLVTGFDAVVHLAGIPHPLDTPAPKVFQVNAGGTFNVLEACAHNGIRRFVFMSSESTLGFAFSTRRMWPEYVPIDEEHPLRPQDAYGLSKMVCEQLCEGFSRRTGMTTIALRAPWIWVPVKQEIERYRSLVRDYPQWSKNLWAFIHVDDVAQAIERSLGANAEGFEAMFISAAENWTGVESRVLLERFYPETRNVRKGWKGRASFLSYEKASRLLRFAPRYSVADVIQTEGQL